jgi:hypothetical protein
MLGEEAIPYGAAAETLRMDEGAVRLAVHRYGRGVAVWSVSDHEKQQREKTL